MRNICWVCKKEFDAFKGTKRYCSLACNNKALKARGNGVSYATWTTPTKEEDEKRIIELAKMYQQRKWYQIKQFMLDEMMVCAFRLNFIHKRND
ncbi:MAG: hypothetical protein WC917_04235 [Bacilli bacterium]|jgi:hypothetical protein